MKTTTVNTLTEKTWDYLSMNNSISGLPYYASHKQYGHWMFSGVDDPETAFGFTYIITNLLTGKKYIGCKQIIVSKKKKGEWQSYTGSNKQLNYDIGVYGKQNFFFEIMSLYYNKQSLRMGEARLILGSDALNRADYYNEYLQLRIRVLPKNKVAVLPKLTRINN